MNDKARATATAHVDVGELSGHRATHHDNGKISICLTGYPVNVYLTGTPVELEEFLVDVRCAITAAVAEHETVPA